MKKMLILLISTYYFSVHGYKLLNKVKVTHQGKGHIKFKVKISTSPPILCQILLILIC